MIELDPEPRRLAFLLGLGDLNRTPVCHGYASCCGCEDCAALSENVSPAFRRWVEDESDLGAVPNLLRRAESPVQPWELRKAA